MLETLPGVAEQTSPNTVENNAGSTTNTVPSEINPLEDPKRVEFWQSKADRYKQTVDRLMPLVDILENNPELVEQIERKVSPRMDAAPSRPVPPERPYNYNEVEAYTVPESASFKYRISQEKYRDDVINWQTKQMELREIKEREMVEHQKMLQQRDAQLYEAGTELKTKFNFQPHEVDDFFRTMSDPSTLQLQNLVEFYRFQKSKKSGGNGLPATPPPPSASGAVRPSPDAHNQAFNSFLKSNS